MFISELKARIEEASRDHMMFHRASGELSLPAELKVAVPYYDVEGKFYGYGDASVYYEPGLDRFIIEQPPDIILGQ